jgi:DNA-binding FrmR family transcriptional regulator
MVKQQHNHHVHKHGEPNTKARKVINMAIGSVAKIPEMVDDGRYCPEVIQQIDSVIGLLHSARKELLKGHLESCLAEQLKTDKEGSIKELLKIYNMQ